jgi:outer membrane protein TolC
MKQMSRRSSRVLVFTVCLCAFAPIPVPLGAQQEPPVAAPQPAPEPLTLEQALARAETRSEPVVIARAGIARADADRVRARSNLLPQLSAAASYDRALASEFEGVFGGTGAPACAPFMLDPTAPIDARVAEIERAIDCGAVGSGVFGGGGGTTNGDGSTDFSDLPFGRENTWRGSLSFSQNLYSGGRNGAQLAIADAGRDAARLGLTTTRGQLFLDVASAYYDVALSARLVSIAEATFEQADATLKQVQAGFDAGTQPEFEVLRARVNRDNQTPVVIQQRLNREVALLRLKQLLDLPPAMDLQIPDVLSDDTLPAPEPFASRVAAAERVITTAPDGAAAIAEGLRAPLPSRAAVDAATAEVKRAEAALKLAEAQKMPSASITSSYVRVAYPGGAFPTGDFRTNWSVGASVQVPILTGGRQRGDEAAARADVDETRARLQQTQELAGLDTRLAWAELLAARATWEASAGTVQQATRAYEIAEVRYGAGVSTQLELSDARLLLQQAQANRAQAARDVQVARARVALIADLPLSTTGSAAGAAGSATRSQRQTIQTTPAPQPAGAASTFTTGQGAQTQAGR